MAARVIAVAGVGFAVAAFRSNHSARPPGTADTPTNGKVAFATGVAGHWQIFTVATDGTEATSLTDLPTNQFHPAWSPDGTKIGFDAQSGGGDTQIRVMDADGSNLQTVASAQASSRGGGMPIGWSFCVEVTRAGLDVVPMIRETELRARGPTRHRALVYGVG